MATFNPSEIYQFALQIEENGEKFYTTMAKKLKDEKVVKLFTFLAKEEVGHKNTFQKLLSGFENYSPSESYKDEYFQYFKAYSKNLIFNLEKFDEEMAEVDTIEKAFRFAIEKEINTIAYFHEMKELVHEGEKSKIEAIIEEERKHVVKLFEAQKEI